jgi:UDP-GlcNAc:undecaprenyl-phosphate/decaprenyl-phosphate GlcNAc-1-phosphate transferase
MLSPSLTLLLAFVVSGCLTWLTITLCRQNGWLFHPRAERWSRKSVAKFGGLPIVVTLAVLAQMQPLSARLLDIVFLTLAITAIGLWDDIRALPPLGKLVCQIAVAGAAVYAGVLYPLPTHPYLAIALTVVWIVGVTNAFNLLDNMDGLTAGVALIASATLVVLGKDTLSNPVIVITFIGALGGFLLFNFSPAKIFMGDAGSLAIGFFIACVSVIAAERIREAASVIVVPVLVVFIPIFDTSLVSITRRIHGRAISAGARDHSSHRLVLLGLSERAAVLTLYSIAVLSGIVAYASRVLYPQAGIGLIAVFLLASGLFWLYLAQLQLPDEWLSRTNVATLAIPVFLNTVTKRTRMVVLDSGLIVLSLYLSFVLRFDRVVSGLDVFLLLCAALLSIKLLFLAIFGAYARSASRSAQFYAIVKAAILSCLFVVALLTFLNRFENLSRAVFAIDLVVSAALMIGVRYSNSIFDDILTRREANGRCLIVGDGSAVLFQNYFGWKEINKELVAAVVTSANTVHTKLVVPAFDFSELPRILVSRNITDVYLLPDCPPEYGTSVIDLCVGLNVSIRRFEFGVVPAEKKVIETGFPLIHRETAGVRQRRT